MTTLMMRLYRARDAIALAPALVAVFLLVGLQYDRTVVVHYRDEKKPVELKLVDAPPDPAPPKPVIQPPTPPTPQKAAPQPPQPVAEPTPQAPAVVTTAASSAVSVPAPVVASPAPPRVETPPAPPAKVAPPNVEADYVAKVRKYLNDIKRYPKGREVDQQRPRGTAKVWFVLKRDGTLSDSGIETSSYSIPLDEAARKTVNRASYPGFPEQAWPGEASHRFTVEMDFIPPGG